MRWMVALVALVGCDEDGEGSEPEPTSDCSMLSVDACADETGCGLIEAWEVEDDGAGGVCVDHSTARVAVGCLSDDVGCTDALVTATSPDDVTYVFSNGCLPPDYTEVADVVDCEG